MQTSFPGTHVTDGLKASSLMKLGLESSLDDETQILLPAKTIVSRTPAEFISMRTALL